MLKKLTLAHIIERLIYLLAAALVPSIPLFFLYGQNVHLEELSFRYFLVTSGVLAAISLILYLPISIFVLRRRRAMIIIALFWTAFWFFNPLSKIITGNKPGYSQWKIAVCLLFLVVVIGLFLRRIKINRLVANTIAILFCLMFAFNFIPQALTVKASEKQKAYNEKTNKLPYKVKTEFNLDHNLPKPNIYWLHMDGMMGFDAIERHFNDSQTALKDDLAERGFVINKSARLEGGNTNIAVSALTSPVFYDSFLAEVFNKAAQLVRGPRVSFISASISEKGFTLSDIYPKTEILKALSEVGYVNISNSSSLATSDNLNIQIRGSRYMTDLGIFREKENIFNKVVDFIDLIADASVLSVIKPKIDEMLEKKKPFVNTQSIPAYQETVDKYVTGYSDLDNDMANKIKAMKYTASIQSPHFLYFNNSMAHCKRVDGTVIGDVVYDVFIGRTFIYDENGNIYKDRLDDPNDVHLYLPQHKYAVKQMMAQVDTIIENDPDAIIIVQGDHGIHGIGNGNDYFDSKFMLERGYSLEDQINLNVQVISAVRIPPQYGKLSQPLDPLDIARYLVNNFVGKGNYDYLYYTEE